MQQDCNRYRRRARGDRVGIWATRAARSEEEQYLVTEPRIRWLSSPEFIPLVAPGGSEPAVEGASSAHRGRSLSFTGPFSEDVSVDFHPVLDHGLGQLVHRVRVFKAR
jgi:hypothetical protein